jgi:S-adenosylmethionine synthetase
MEELDLRRPIYKKTAAFGHFGRTEPSSPGSAPTRPRR